MRSFKFFLAALALVWVANPAFAEQLKSCDADCRAMRSAKAAQPKPTSVPLVCFHFQKLRAGATVLTLFGKNGEEVRRVAKKTGVAGKYCLGRHWVARASQVELCDENRTRGLRQRHLKEVLRLGRTPKGDPIRLWEDEK